MTDAPSLAEPSFTHFVDLVGQASQDQSLDTVLAAVIVDNQFVLLGQFSDEELAAIDGQVDAETNPWLSALSEEQQRVAIGEGRLALTSRSAAEFENGKVTAPSAEVAAVVWARNTITGLGYIDIEKRDPEPHLAARVILYRSHPDLYCIHLIGPLGFHDFSFANRRTVGHWLVKQTGTDPTTAPEEEQLFVTDSPQTLVDQIDHLKAKSDRTTRVFVREGDGTTRHVVVYQNNRQVWLCENFNPADESIEVRLRITTPHHLALYLSDMIGPHS